MRCCRICGQQREKKNQRPNILVRMKPDVFWEFEYPLHLGLTLIESLEAETLSYILSGY